MNQAQRDRMARSVGLTFRQSITAEEFEEMAETAKTRACPHCGDGFNVALGFTGPMTAKGNRYCTPRCVEQKERELAPRNHYTPKGTQIEGWDV